MIASRAKVRVRRRQGAAAVILSAGEVEAAFLPSVGMLGTSLKVRGEEFLALPGGLRRFRAGHTSGLPLLAPWANRLGRRQYRASGVDVDLHGLDLPTDGKGLPIHGTMIGELEWDVVSTQTSMDTSTLQARFDYEPPEPFFAAFPFPHEITLKAIVGGDGLVVETTVRPSADLPVPISFGFHPYFRLPGSGRSVWRIRLPECHHLQLDSSGLPTGKAETMPAEEKPLGTRAFDDAYGLVGEDRQFALSAGGRRLVIDFEENYPYGQVYAPRGGNFVCVEPMTAPVNALVDGRFQAVPPGETFSARFSVRVQPEGSADA